MNSTAIEDASGKIVIAAQILDISNYKKAEEELRESAKKYKDILASIMDCYFEVDIHGNLNFFNDVMVDYLGYSKEELMGMNFRQYMDDSNAEKVYRIFNTVFTTDKPEKGFDFELIRKDGSRLNVETSLTPIKNAKGQVIGFRGISRDCTLRKTYENKLKAAHDELEIRVKERTEELAKINEELEAKTLKLEEINIALRILLEKRNEDKKVIEEKMYQNMREFEENTLFNVRELVEPYLDKIEEGSLNDRQKAYIEIMKSNLNDIISPFVRHSSPKHLKLTPSEIKMTNLIKRGKVTARTLPNCGRISVPMK